jgi:hypothetical protein
MKLMVRKTQYCPLHLNFPRNKTIFFTNNPQEAVFFLGIKTNIA